jgi:YjbE family integral membrane protein
MARKRIVRLGFWGLALMVVSGVVWISPVWAATGIDFGWLGKIEFTWGFCVGFFSIVLIDLVLAGDNAVVIALAVKNLHGKQRTTGIIAGAGAAVALRVVLTFFVAQILRVSFVKLLGGMLILWIAVKLFIEGAPEDKFQKPATTFWQAIRVIVIADLIMSTDNILAVAGACKGNFFLLLFGLALSIPFVVFTSSLLSLLMDKYPVIVWIGAAVLGRVGGEMIITDPWVVEKIVPSKALQYACEIIGAVGVIVVSKLYMRWKIARQAEALAKGAEPIE